MNKKQREIIFNKTNGKCSYCGEMLQRGWHVDHIEPVIRKSKYTNGKLISTQNMRRAHLHHEDNMMPSCPSCNILKSTSSVDGFREVIADRLRQLDRNPSYRMAKRYGLITESEIDIKFYFETMQQE